MSQLAGSSVYLGPWINWSHGSILGATITLSARDGGLLTAFLALFVAAAGAAWWRISSYILHQYNAKHEYQDGLHHQRQAIFRNTSTPGGASWEFFQLAWYWRENATKSLLRTLPVIILALLNLTLFAVAGIFSSEVTKAAGNETLIRSPNCGYLSFTANGAHLSTQRSIDLNDTLAATTYSRACYGNNKNNLQCNQYPQSSLSWKTNRNATCPFSPEMCYFGPAAAYEMDTGKLDSHDALGINAPKSDRVHYRKVTTCAPLHMGGHTNISNDTNPDDVAYGDSFLNILYGDAGITVGGINVTYQYNLHSVVDSMGYTITSLLATANETYRGWTPIPALNRTDADLSVFFLAPNSVDYEQPVYDPFFNATTPYDLPNGDGTNTTFFSPDQPLYALGCIDQHQFCNPNNDECTPLTAASLFGISTVGSRQLDFNKAQFSTAIRMTLALGPMNTYNSVNSRGANALLASESVYNNIQIYLPPTQWMAEVSNWFAVSMAKLQQKTIEFATGPENIPEGATLTDVAHADKYQARLCKNQKIRAYNGTTSFSVLGVAIILVVGSILILTNLVLDTLMGFIRRKLGWKDYKSLQWTVDGKLQLQRLAYEGAGQGQWSGGADSVPVTRRGDLLGMPMGVNKRHPLFSNEPGRGEVTYVGAVAPEAEGLMHGGKGAGQSVEPVPAWR